MRPITTTISFAERPYCEDCFRQPVSATHLLQRYFGVKHIWNQFVPQSVRGDDDDVVPYLETLITIIGPFEVNDNNSSYVSLLRKFSNPLSLRISSITLINVSDAFHRRVKILSSVTETISPPAWFTSSQSCRNCTPGLDE